MGLSPAAFLRLKKIRTVIYILFKFRVYNLPLPRLPLLCKLRGRGDGRGEESKSETLVYYNYGFLLMNMSIHRKNKGCDVKKTLQPLLCCCMYTGINTLSDRKLSCRHVPSYFYIPRQSGSHDSCPTNARKKPRHRQNTSP